VRLGLVPFGNPRRSGSRALGAQAGEAPIYTRRMDAPVWVHRRRVQPRRIQSRPRPDVTPASQTSSREKGLRTSGGCALARYIQPPARFTSHALERRAVASACGAAGGSAVVGRIHQQARARCSAVIEGSGAGMSRELLPVRRGKGASVWYALRASSVLQKAAVRHRGTVAERALPDL
jgi:hypothetical protein